MLNFTFFYPKYFIIFNFSKAISILTESDEASELSKLPTVTSLLLFLRNRNRKIRIEFQLLFRFLVQCFIISNTQKIRLNNLTYRDNAITVGNPNHFHRKIRVTPSSSEQIPSRLCPGNGGFSEKTPKSYKKG